MMKRNLLALCVCAGLLGSGCVNQDQVDAMQARIRQQDQQIEQLTAQLSGVQPAQADTWAQVQSLRQEMSAVRGQIDDFNHAAAALGGLPGLAERISRHDEALRAIDTQFALNLPLGEPAPAPSVSTSLPGLPGQPGLPGAPAGTKPAGSALAGPAGTASAGATPGGAAGTAAAPGEKAAPETPPAVKKPEATEKAAGTDDTAKALYDAGIASFNARKYNDAYLSFNDFTKAYPKHRLAANAWFWRGECRFQSGSFAEAALDYEKVITEFPSSGKAASAYLKQGMCFIKLEKKDAARVRLNEVVKKFPKAPEATRAKQLLKTL